ncbi:hypothetical protein HDV06_002600 [Boothiomyces sp. JEL0866]|nr:hypothetical protein HDV06_002600 [Boothiomyces sp. JEL0866]
MQRFLYVGYVIAQLDWECGITAQQYSTGQDSWLTTNKTYYINIWTANNGIKCDQCTLSIYNNGSGPIISFPASQQTLVSTNAGGNSYYSQSQNLWSFPITFESYGIVSFNITSLVLTSYNNSVIPPLEVTSRVNWISTAGFSISSVIPSGLTALKLNSVPGVESLWSITTNNGMYFSTNEFTTIYEILFNLENTLGISTDICSGSSISSITYTDSYLASDILYLVSNVGLIMGTYSRGSTSWQIVLPRCIKKLIKQSQQSGTVNTWQPVIAIGGNTDIGSIWYSNVSSAAFSKAPSMSNVFPSANSAQIVDAVYSIIQQNSIYVLALVDSTYYLLRFYTNSLLWTIVFKIPRTLDQITSSNANTAKTIWNDLTDSLNAVGSNNFTLSLTNLYMHNSPTLDLFITGNCVLYSPAMGNSIVIYNSFSNSTVSSFTSHVNGRYVVATADNRFYLGYLGLGYLYEFQTTSQGVYAPFYGDYGQLKELSLTSGNLQVANLNPTVNESNCPYSTKYFIYNSLEVYNVIPNATAYNPTPQFTVTELPKIVYLDYLESFSFQAVIVPSDWNQVNDFAIEFQISNNQIISVNSTRKLDYLRNTIVYTVTVADKGVLVRDTNVLSSSIRLLVKNDNFGCHSSSLEESQTITVYSGCSGTLNLMLNTTAFPTCATTNFMYPCIPFQTTFYPSFLIYDSITGENSSFIYDYQLQVIAGGPSASSLSNYSSSQIQSYNPNSKLPDSNSLVYVIANNDPNNDVTFSITDGSIGINWKCRSGSPCYNIPASSFGSSPIYYFTIQITALPSTSNIETYCNLNSNIVVGLVHIPASLEVQLVSIFGSACICFFLTGIYFWFREAKPYQRVSSDEKNTVRFFNIEVDDQFEREPSLNRLSNAKIHITVDEDKENPQALDVQLKNGEEELPSPDVNAPDNGSDSSDSDVEPGGSLHALNKIGLSLSTSKLNKE